MKDIIKILSDKLLVKPEKILFEIKKGQYKKIEDVKSIHLLSEQDKFYPEGRSLALHMPISATRKIDMNMFAEEPKQIVVPNARELKTSFSLSAIRAKKKLTDFSSDELETIKSFGNEKLEEQEEISAPDIHYLHLPLDENEGVLTRDYTYKKVIECLANDLYRDYMDRYISVRKFKKSERDENGHPILSQEEKERVKGDFIESLKEFDAFEIGHDNGIPYAMQFVGYEGLDENKVYETYYIVLYKISEKTDRERAIKKKIIEKVDLEKKNVKVREKREKERQALLAQQKEGQIEKPKTMDSDFDKK